MRRWAGWEPQCHLLCGAEQGRTGSLACLFLSQTIAPSRSRLGKSADPSNTYRAATVRERWSELTALRNRVLQVASPKYVALGWEPAPLTGGTPSCQETSRQRPD